MPNNEERRQEAKRKLENKIEQQEVQAKRRRTITIGTTVAVVIALVVGVFYFINTSGGDNQASDEPQQQAKSNQSDAKPLTKATTGPCSYQPTEGEPPAKPVKMPPDPEPSQTEGTVDVQLRFSEGLANLELDRAKAPCTVQSFEHLVNSSFFNDTECHRISTEGSLKMLQCGDPTGTGKGGPGYSIKDEVSPDQKYPRGTLAMAKSSQPDSGGSQFFMVFGESQLPPEYTAFGTIDEAGLKVLDKIAAAGSDNSEAPGAGKPNAEARIRQATIM